MSQYISQPWQQLLKANQLDNFEAFWQLDAGWVEEPNFRRGGWSGVSKHTLNSHDGSHKIIYIKRQENHISRSLRNPIRGIPTVRREANNILNFNKQGIPTLSLVYYSERSLEGRRQAILATEELTDYLSLDEWLQQWQQTPLAIPLRNKVIEASANTIKQVHDAGFRHGCLYAKHLFLKVIDNKDVSVKIIDLEKAKPRLRSRHRMIRDLATMYKHTACSNTARMKFSLYYFGLKRMNNSVKSDIAAVLKRARRKLKRNKAKVRHESNY